MVLFNRSACIERIKVSN